MEAVTGENYDTIPRARPYSRAMPELPAEIIRHYERQRPESTRITEGFGTLERERTREVLGRHLPRPPARVIDVGGGEGVHARWLADRGYDAHLVDPVPAHVAAADGAPYTAALGDARALECEDETFAAALVLGPCYHLVERDDRVLALREARRVVRAGGVIFVAAVSRYASLFDGLARGYLFDDEFLAIVERDLRDGVHRNDDDRPHWFTTAYFHRPDELVREAVDAGLAVRELVGLEGMAGWQQHLAARWEHAADRERILAAARATESAPELAGLSAHLLLVAERH
jgi:ubiquinone/menaquinone biosynthesis C-methylase UbiE